MSMFCIKCGSPNSEGARFCEKCGNALSAGSAGPTPAGGPPPLGYAPPPTINPTGQAGDRNPLLAVLLSFFIPGVGQFYNNDPKKGGAMLGALVLSWILMVFGIGFLTGLGVWIWSMIDAYQVAGGTGARW